MRVGFFDQLMQSHQATIESIGDFQKVTFQPATDIFGVFAGCIQYQDKNNLVLMEIMYRRGIVNKENNSDIHIIPLPAEIEADLKITQTAIEKAQQDKITDLLQDIYMQKTETLYRIKQFFMTDMSKEDQQYIIQLIQSLKNNDFYYQNSLVGDIAKEYAGYYDIKQIALATLKALAEFKVDEMEKVNAEILQTLQAEIKELEQPRSRCTIS